MPEYDDDFLELLKRGLLVLDAGDDDVPRFRPDHEAIAAAERDADEVAENEPAG